MDQRLLDKNGLTESQAAGIMDALRKCLVECAAQGDSVAIPGFGTFVTVKDDERVDRDLSTGKKVLVPPHLSVGFKAGSALLKSINQGL